MLQIFSDIGRKKLKLAKSRPTIKIIAAENSRGKNTSVCAQKRNRAEVRRERKKRDKPQPCLWAILIITKTSAKHYYFCQKLFVPGENYLTEHTLKVRILIVILPTVKYNIKIFSARQLYFDHKNKIFLPTFGGLCLQAISLKPTGNAGLPQSGNHNSLS